MLTTTLNNLNMLMRFGLNCLIKFTFWLLLANEAMSAQVHTNLLDFGVLRISFSSHHRIELGHTVSGSGDFDGDGLLDIAIGAPSYNPQELGYGFDNGAVFVVRGKALLGGGGQEINISAQSSECITILGRQESKIGRALTCPGDINADGIDDLAIATDSDQAGFIIFGSRNPKQFIYLDELNEDDGVEILNSGLTVEAAGDVNGDGIPDVAFGDPYAEQITTNGKDFHVGLVSIILGNPNLPSKIDARVPANSIFSIRGEAGALTGSGLVGNINLNDDPFSDLFVVSAAGGKNFQGQGYLIHGSESIDKEPAPIHSFQINGAHRRIHSAKDVNNDGYSDLLVEGEDSTWHLLFGGDYKGSIDVDRLKSDWGISIVGAQAVYGVGDLNGDGFNDLAAALPNETVDGNVLAGRVVFVFGHPDLPKQIDINAICEGGIVPVDYVLIDGIDAFGTFGVSVAAVGDIEGDGYDDVIIGAPSERLPGERQFEKPGNAYVIRGETLFMSLQTSRSVLHQPSRTYSLENSKSHP